MKLRHKVKEGNFGVVYQAEWKIDPESEPKIVAAKTLKGGSRHVTAIELENFLKEGVMMRGECSDNPK